LLHVRSAIFLYHPNDMSQFEFVERLIKRHPKIGVVVARYSWGTDERRDMYLLGIRFTEMSLATFTEFSVTLRKIPLSSPEQRGLRDYFHTSA
jgi:hypothetical protein